MSYLFDRFRIQTKQNIAYDEKEPIFISALASKLWQVVSENPEDEEVKELLDELVGQKKTGMNEVTCDENGEI